MSLYYRNLKRIGIWMICVAAADLVYELTARRILLDLLCSGHVTDNMRDMMREVFRMHFEASEDSVSKQPESRYSRVMILVSVSVFVIGVVRQTSMVSDEMPVWRSSAISPPSACGR